MKPKYQVFKPYSPQSGSWNYIHLPYVVEVVGKFRQQGYTASIRQIYYQLVSHYGLPNTPEGYDKVQNLLWYARMGGYVSFNDIVDRGRDISFGRSGVGSNDTVEDGILSCIASASCAADCYRQDPWCEMEEVPVVMVEKDALSGVLSPICREYGIPFISAHGNPSITLLKDLADMMIRRGQEATSKYALLHLTDHDPAGLYSMVDQLVGEDSVVQLCGARLGRDWTYKRIGLTRQQVEQYRLPPNPVKESHGNSKQYVADHGTASWELDALDASVLSSIVRKEIEPFRSDEVWQQIAEKEEAVKEGFRIKFDSFWEHAH